MVDIIVSPVSPGTPPKIGSSLDHPLEMYLSDAIYSWIQFRWFTYPDISCWN